MGSLNSVAELAWMQVYPQPDDETALPVEVFQEAAILEYAYQIQLMYWKDKRDEGYAEIPSHLLRSVDLPVSNNEVDISCLNVFRTFSSDVWLSRVGALGGCNYIRNTINTAQLLTDDEGRGHNDRTYIPVGNKIKFPQGTSENTVTIIYASKGEELDGDIEIDEVIGNIVRDRLVEKFLGKSNPVDTTNNSTA